MPDTVTWLHLSDLHAMPRSEWDAAQVKRTLRDDLRRMHKEHGLQPDLLFFTGDAAFGQIGTGAGQTLPEQFKLAQEFLAEARAAFPQPIPLERTFLVPGNHDVNRDEITPMQTGWLNHPDRTLDEIVSIMQSGKKEWLQCMERLEDYAEFLRTQGYLHLIDPEGRLIFGHAVQLDDVRIGIAGFNSAWSCNGGETDRNHVWVGGEFQAAELLRRIGPVDFQIALIHHPESWLVRQERPEFYRLLEREFQFVLHGHEHDVWVKPDPDTGHTTISAGACYEHSTKENGYNFVRLDLRTGRGQVWLRQFDKKGGGWVDRNVANRTRGGCWKLKHLTPWMKTLKDRLTNTASNIADVASDSSSRKRVTDSEHDAPAATTRPTRYSALPRAAHYERRFREAMGRKWDYVELFGADVPLESRRQSLSVAYVSLELSEEEPDEDGMEPSEPGHRKHPSSSTSDDEQELAPVGRKTESHPDDGGWTLTGSVPAEEVFAQLRPEAGRLLIRGVAGSGKTTLLRWVTVEAAKWKGSDGEHWRSKVPFLIRLRDCPDGTLPRPKDFPALLAKELPDPTPEWIDEVLTAGRGLLMFDGVDEVPAQHRDQVRRELEAIVGEYGRNYFVVTTRPAAVERHWLARIGFFEARVEPMSLADQDRFIDKWHAAIAAELRAMRRRAGNLEDLATALKRELRSTPAIARLTIYPLLCAAVCALHRERNQKLPETQVQLCEDLCKMLLHRRERETPDLKPAHLSPSYLKLTYENKKYIVAELAYEMMNRGGLSSLPLTDVDQLVAAALQHFPEHATADPAEIRQGLLERSGLLRPSGRDKIDFIHNTLKEYLAAGRFVDNGADELLASHAEDGAWQAVILFAAAIPKPEFASQLVRHVLGMLKQPSRKKTRRKSCNSRTSSPRRALEFFAVRLRAAAFRLEPHLVQRVDQVASRLFPPRTVADAEALATCGEAVVPFLIPKPSYSAPSKVACLRALRLIGGPRAEAAIAEHFVDGSSPILSNEILRTIRELGVSVVAASLRSLRVDRADDFDLLAGLTNLQSLDLSRTEVSDLTPLAGLTNLRSLDLSRTEVSDLTPLVRLANLQSLNLSECWQVRDLTPLAGLTNLQSLGLSGCAEVSDLTPLAGLPNLQSLDLIGTPYTDLTPLASLPNLRTLSLDGSNVSRSVAESLQSKLRGCDIVHWALR